MIKVNPNIIEYKTVDHLMLSGLNKKGKTTATRYGYAKVCQASKGLGSRQPIAVSSDELERINNGEELGSGPKSYFKTLQVKGREEINGKEIPHKYIDLDKKNEYNIVFTYSLVHYDKLKTRIYNRFISELNGYDRDRYNKKAPRLPDYSDDFLTPHVNDITKTLLLIRNFCLLNDPKKKDEKKEQNKICKKIIGKNNNRINLLIFSNNNDNHVRELIYDHKKFDKYISEKDFTDLIKNHIYTHQ